MTKITKNLWGGIKCGEEHRSDSADEYPNYPSVILTGADQIKLYENDENGPSILSRIYRINRKRRLVDIGLSGSNVNIYL